MHVVDDNAGVSSKRETKTTDILLTLFFKTMFERLLW